MQIGAKVMLEKKKAEVWASFHFAHSTIVSFIAVSELLVLECSTCSLSLEKNICHASNVILHATWYTVGRPLFSE
jgi:hypothetical protein